MGPSAPSPEPDQVLPLLRGSFQSGLAVPSHTVLDAVLGSGNPQIMNNAHLVAMLRRWPGLMEALALDGEHLERNRDVDLHAALVEIGIPGIAIAAGGAPLGLPATAFPTDVDRMVRSVEVYAGLYYRAFRFAILTDDFRSGVEAADVIIRELDALSAR